MAVGKPKQGKMSPVHFFSHGSTMMLGEDSASARYWERMGDEALKNGVEHVVIMVSEIYMSMLMTSLNTDTHLMHEAEWYSQICFLGATLFLSSSMSCSLISTLTNPS